MITLVTFPAGWGEASFSPFCVKAMYLLNASGLPWKREDQTDPRKYPQGKFPAIRAEGKLIGDSENIRQYLVDQGRDIDAHLTPEQRAELLAWTRLAEEHLYYHQVLDRWYTPDVWDTTRKDYFKSLPFPVNKILPRVLRKNLLSGLNFLGHTRFPEEMRMRRLDQDLKAIAARIGDKPFLFGDRPSSVDASIGAILGGLRATPVHTVIRKRVTGDAALMAYADRVAETMGASAASG